MTTQTLSQPTATTITAAPGRRPEPDLSGPPGIPFGRLLWVEARKLVDTRAGRGLLVAIAVVTAASVGLTMWFTTAGEISFAGLLTASVTPQLFLIPVFGVLAATSEVSQRTGLVTYCLEPRRWRVVAAKALAAVAFSLVLLAAGALVAAVAHALAIGVKDAPGGWSVPWDVAAGIVLSQVLVVLQGVAFGLFFRSTALAIVVFFVLPTVFTVVTGLVERVRDIAPWIDFGTASVPLMTGEMSGRGWAHLATSGGLWILLPLAVGTWLLARREVA